MQNQEKISPKISSTHHVFDIDLAALYGVHCAILIHHFQYWIAFNRRLKRNLKEGRTWMYQTRAEILAHFPYLTEKELRGALERLVEKKIIIKSNFNNTSFDRTTWFAFVTEADFLNKLYDEPKGPMDWPKGPMEDDKRAELPLDTYTDTETDSKTDLKKKEAPPPLLEKGKYVRIPKEDFEKLQEEYGLQRIEAAIQEINDYLASTGRKPYKDYAATIRNWLKRDFNTKKVSGVDPKTEAKKTNLLTAREAQSGLRAMDSPKFKEFFIADKELVRLDTGNRISLYLSPFEFEEKMLQLFNLGKSNE